MPLLGKRETATLAWILSGNSAAHVRKETLNAKARLLWKTVKKSHSHMCIISLGNLKLFFLWLCSIIEAGIIKNTWTVSAAASR